MKKYLVFGLIVVVVAMLGALISRNFEWEEYTVPAELRGDAARNPFYAAERFARSLGATTEWRQALGDLPPPPAVLVLRNWRWNLIASRRIAIERWVEAGGRLVIDAGVWDEDDAFAKWSGLSEEEDSEDSEEPEPEADCKALTVTHDVDAVSAGHASYRLCTTWFSTGRLASQRSPQWSLSDDLGMQATRVAIGRGSVTWLNMGGVLDNRKLTEAEHGLVFVALTQLRPGDQFVFLSETGSPSLLALIWRYGAPVVIVAALALGTLLWRSGVRFGPPAAEPELARRSLVEQIRGSGRFVLRYGNGAALHAAAMRAVYEAAQRRIPLWSSLPPEERVLALARATGVPETELREAALHNDQRSKHELKRALERLEQTRRRLIKDI